MSPRARTRQRKRNAKRVDGCTPTLTIIDEAASFTTEQLASITPPKEPHEAYLRRLVGQLHGECAAWNLSPADTRWVLEGVCSRVRDDEQAEKRRKDKEQK